MGVRPNFSYWVDVVVLVWWGCGCVEGIKPKYLILMKSVDGIFNGLGFLGDFLKS